MVRTRIPLLVCLAILCGIMTLGLWPFHRRLNEVYWLRNEDGLGIGGYGTIVSTGTFQADGLKERDSCSLEIWFQPDLTSDSNTFLAFSTPENPLQLTLHQYHSNLILKRASKGDELRGPEIGIANIFQRNKRVFLAVTSSPQETAMYLDGALAHKFPRVRLANEFTGQLELGTSPVRVDGWPGRLRGLALYQTELTAEQVLLHYETWTKEGAPEIHANERATALYLFNEGSGNVVHNAVHPGIDLYIPKRFSLLHQIFLKPFWREYTPGWDYCIDIFLNVAAFIPLGFSFCCFWSSVRPLSRPTLAATLLGLAVSLTIEILQSYLPTRNSGTTDLFTNTIGTYLGAKFCGTAAAQSLLEKVSWAGFLPRAVAAGASLRNVDKG